MRKQALALYQLCLRAACRGKACLARRTRIGFTKLVLLLLAWGLVGGFSSAQETPTPTPTMPMSGMGMMESEFITDELAPLVKGIYEGEDLFFIHTEASDPDVANVLTEMMGPQVITVPGLADIPKELLGNVYVFTNGVMGGGPMGFQPDVFDSIPGDNEYTPLRMIHFITWQDQAAPRILNSVAEIEAAELEGEIEIERSDIVVNMPILVWPGGHR